MKKEKLVRDKIPELFNFDDSFTFRIAEEDEKEHYLWEKFYEETREFIHNPTIEELTDIIEVCMAILNKHDLNELIEQVLLKRGKRGGFDQSFIMEWEDGH